MAVWKDLIFISDFGFYLFAKVEETWAYVHSKGKRGKGWRYKKNQGLLNEVLKPSEGEVFQSTGKGFALTRGGTFLPFFLRQKEGVGRGRGERRENPKQAPRTVWGLMQGLDLMTLEIMTWDEIISWTLNWMSHRSIPFFSPFHNREAGKWYRFVRSHLLKECECITHLTNIYQVPTDCYPLWKMLGIQWWVKIDKAPALRLLRICKRWDEY